MFCILDEVSVVHTPSELETISDSQPLTAVVAAVLLQVQADIARDALQHFAILSGKDDKTKGRILRASKALQRLLNYDLDTPFPRDLSVFWGANTDRSTIDEINASIKSNRPYSGEVLCYKHTGQTLWCEISLQAIAINQDAPRNGTVCIACFIRDIDEIHCAVRICLALPLAQRRKHLRHDSAMHCRRTSGAWLGNRCTPS